MPEVAGAWSSIVTGGSQMWSTMNSRLPVSLEPKKERVSFRKDRGRSRREEGGAGRSVMSWR
jgi:hypothetical protein